MLKRLGQWALVVGLGAAALAMLLWAGLAAWFGPLPRAFGLTVVALGLVADIGLWARLRPLPRAALASLGVGLLLVLAWSFGLRPSNDRQWQPDVARTAYATLAGRRVTVHNVRHCEYRSEADFTTRYEDRVYDLDALRSADLFLVDWGLGTIAHTMVSFGFATGQYLCFSIETRKEVGEAYSATKGFFRNYELIYIAADEQDVVRLRTSFRQNESVYLYRLRPRNPAAVEGVFLEYLRRLNQLHEQAEWYNALTDNCMTSAYKNMRRHAVHTQWDWRILANGHAAELAYEEGAICTDLPFSELKKASLVNARALNVNEGGDFSAAIREGLPGIDNTAIGAQ